MLSAASGLGAVKFDIIFRFPQFNMPMEAHYQVKTTLYILS